MQMWRLIDFSSSATTLSKSKEIILGLIEHFVGIGCLRTDQFEILVR